VINNFWIQEIYINSINATGQFAVLPDIDFASGSISNVALPPRTNTSLTVPMRVVYSRDADPNNVVLQQLLDCQRLPEGSTMPINYKANISVSLLGIGPFLLPELSSKYDAACPKLDLGALLGGALGQVGNLVSQLPALVPTAAEQVSQQLPAIINSEPANAIINSAPVNAIKDQVSQIPISDVIAALPFRRIGNFSSKA
jgi:hypothetical protein